MFNIQQQEEADYQMNAEADYWFEIAAEHRESPEALAEESAYYHFLNLVDGLDGIEARGGPNVAETIVVDNDCPF